MVVVEDEMRVGRYPPFSSTLSAPASSSLNFDLRVSSSSCISSDPPNERRAEEVPVSEREKLTVDTNWSEGG